MTTQTEIHLSSHNRNKHIHAVKGIFGVGTAYDTRTSYTGPQYDHYLTSAAYQNATTVTRNGSQFSRNTTNAPVIIGMFMCTSTQHDLLRGLWQINPATGDIIDLKGYSIAVIDNNQQFAHYKIESNKRETFEATFVAAMMTAPPFLTEGRFYRVHVRLKPPALVAQVLSAGPNIIPIRNVKVLHNGIQSTMLHIERLTQNDTIGVQEEPVITRLQHIIIHAPCSLAGIRLAMLSPIAMAVDIDIYGSSTDSTSVGFELLISEQLHLQSHQMVDVVIGKSGLLEWNNSRQITTAVKKYEWYHVVINTVTPTLTSVPFAGDPANPLQTDDTNPNLGLYRLAVIGEVPEYNNLVEWRMSPSDVSKLVQVLTTGTLMYIGGVTSTYSVDEANVVCNHVVAVETETIWHDSVSGVIQMRTSKAIPKPLLVHPLYIEVWDDFVVHALEPTRLLAEIPTGRLAHFEVNIPYLLVPTLQRISHSNTLVCNLPYIVCYIRFANTSSTVRMKQQMADVYYDTVVSSSIDDPGNTTPPTWTQSAMRFVLPLSSEMAAKGGAMTLLQCIGTQSIELDSTIRPPDICICTHENKVIDLLPTVQTDLPLPMEVHQSEHIDGNFYIGIVLKKIKYL